MTNRRQTGVLIIACMISLLACELTSAAEYFVNKQGNDGNNGQVREKAFLTVQKGVDALKPGDTLNIGPGEYLETVKIVKSGAPEKETLIRAEISGTVLLRGNQDAPTFGKIEGRRFVYGAECDKKVLSMHEVDSMVKLGQVADVDALEFKPGSWYQDEVNKKLYVSSTDFQAPNRHHYTIGILRGSGFLVEDSQRIVIDGIAASGFMTPAKDPVIWFPEGGFLIHHSKNSIIRHCSSFLNSNGIGIRNDLKDDNGMGSIVDDCRAYGNAGDGIVSFWANNDTFSNSTSFLNGGCGIQFYADGKGDLPFSRNLSWGNSYGDYRMKGLGLPVDKKTAFAERCISLERFDVANIRQCIIGGPNFYRNDTPPDNITMPTQEVKEKEFADPANFDFHLQEGSKFNKPGKEYLYSGPYPYEPNIFYLKLDGDDSLSGLSMANAWKNLNHALTKLKSGDTIYIAAGRYSSDVPLSAKQVKICGRGTEAVIIDGSFKVVDSEDILLERLYFTSPVSVGKGRAVAFNNCIFSGDATAVVKPVSFWGKLMLKEPEGSGVECSNVNGLQITHGVFKIPLKLKSCSKVFLSGNIYATSPAIQVDKINDVIYSSYNSYADTAKCWKANGKAISFDELKKTNDADSRILVPELTEGNGVLTVKNAYQFAGCGPLGSAIGSYREYQLRFMQLIGPFVYSVSDTSASIEWWTNLPANVEFCWGDTPECTNKASVTQKSFYNYGLTGLEPGKKYYVKVKPVKIADEADPGRRFRVPKQDWATAEFTTATKKADTTPHTYYVSNSGNNNNDGLSMEKAWKSLQYAADKVQPGDTVLIAGGKYPGTVYFRITGEKGKPITFKAAVPGEKVAIDGMGETLPNGLVLSGKQYYNFDALNLESFSGEEGTGALSIKGGSNIQVTRCKFGPGWGTGISATACRDLLIKNCILTSGMFIAKFGECPNLRVENNVFIYPLINNIYGGGTANEPATFTSNIFGESIRGKQQQCFVLFGDSKESNNCFFLFWPENERGVINYLTLPEYRATKQTDSFVANPQMPGAFGFLQGWQRTKTDFESLFAANPELVKRGIGLQREAFRDFNFKTEWPYDVAWADKVLADKKAAEDLVKAGKDTEAVVAYTELAKMPMHELLKSELLEQAAFSASRLKQYDQAIAIAKSIPLQPLSVKCQLKIMVDNGKYAEATNLVVYRRDGAPITSWVCPDLEYLFVDTYTYRGTAFAETGDLKAAEYDFKVMAEEPKVLGYDSGVGINELAWLRLGDFYRKYLKDDAKALEAYNHVIDRTFKPWYETKPVPKPALIGDSQTLRDAVQAASEILRKQGKEDEVLKIQFIMLKAQAEAIAKLRKYEEAIAKFKEAMSVRGISADQKDECEKRIRESQLGDCNFDRINDAKSIDAATREKLLKAASNDNALIRKAALEKIIAFLPVADRMQVLGNACNDKDSTIRAIAVKALVASEPKTEEMKELIGKARNDTDEGIRKMAWRSYAAPILKKMSDLYVGLKFQALVDEFKDVDFDSWQDPEMGGQALFFRGWAWAGLKDGGKAERDLKKSIEFSPSNLSEVLMVLGENYQGNLKDDQKALDIYLKYAEKFFSTRPDRDQCMRIALKASGILRKMGRNEEALKILDSSNPKRVAGPWRAQTESMYLDTLAIMGRKADAVAECNKFLELKDISAAEKDAIGKKLKELQGEAGQPTKK